MITNSQTQACYYLGLFVCKEHTVKSISHTQEHDTTLADLIQGYSGIEGCYLLCANGGPEQLRVRKDGSTYTVKARHYLGYAEDIGRRLERHMAGNGGKLVACWNRLGVSWVPARVWPGKGYEYEKYLKAKKCGPRLCPICQEATHVERMDIVVCGRLAEMFRNESVRLFSDIH